MFTNSFRAAALAIFGVMAAGVASAAGDTPQAHEILFGRPHLASVAPGTELIYKFVRKPSDEKVLGAGFTDNISLKVEGDAGAGKKNVVVQIYSGARARDPQRITGMDGNPMLVVFLDNSVSHFRQLAGGDSAYLKGMFARYLNSGAKIDPVKIAYKGEEVDGYKVTATPFVDDPAKSKMNGFEGATFTIALSDKVPGYFAQMVSTISSTDKSAPSLVETTTLDGVGDVK